MNRGILAVVPVRSLRNGKSRLAPTLPAAARQVLTGRLLRGTLAAIIDANVVDALVVVSPDEAARACARDVDPRIVAIAQDPEAPGLNGAIRQARTLALARGAGALLVVFGDLPLLAPSDVAALVASPADVTIARDRHGAGTNALLLRLGGPGRAFGFAFGEGSAARHAAEAARLGLSLAWCDRPGTAFDLDSPDDWELLRLRHARLLDAIEAEPVLVADDGSYR